MLIWCLDKISTSMQQHIWITYIVKSTIFKQVVVRNKYQEITNTDQLI